MTVIGITGGTGAGKTTALNAIADMGGVIIDCDALYHGLLLTSSAMLEEIEASFPGVVTNGVLDRKKLGQRVFSSHGDLETLNRITHTYVQSAIEDVLAEANANGVKLAAIDAIELFSGGAASLCTFTVAVTAPSDVRTERIMKREGISREYAELRIKAQRPDSYFTSLCDYEIINNYDLAEDFNAKCKEFFSDIIRRYEND